MSKRKKDKLKTVPPEPTLKAVPPTASEPPPKSKDGMECVCKVCRRFLDPDRPHECLPDPFATSLTMRRKTPKPFRA